MQRLKPGIDYPTQKLLTDEILDKERTIRKKVKKKGVRINQKILQTDDSGW